MGDHRVAAEDAAIERQRARKLLFADLATEFIGNDSRDEDAFLFAKETRDRLIDEVGAYLRKVQDTDRNWFPATLGGVAAFIEREHKEGRL